MTHQDDESMMSENPFSALERELKERNLVEIDFLTTKLAQSKDKLAIARISGLDEATYQEMLAGLSKAEDDINELKLKLID